MNIQFKVLLQRHCFVKPFIVCPPLLTCERTLFSLWTGPDIRREDGLFEIVYRLDLNMFLFCFRLKILLYCWSNCLLNICGIIFGFLSISSATSA